MMAMRKKNVVAKMERTKVMQRNLIHYSLVSSLFFKRHEICENKKKWKEKSRPKMCKDEEGGQSVNRTKYNKNIGCNSTVRFLSILHRAIKIQGVKLKFLTIKMCNVQLFVVRFEKI